MTARHPQSDPLPLPPILSAGTKVVARVDVRGPHGALLHPAGAVGVIAVSPADPRHAYRVRFLDGAEVSLARDELVVLKHFQREEGGGAETSWQPHADYDYRRHVILRVVVGSRAYGLHHATSDTDHGGVYVPPADRQWSLWGVPEQLEDDATQETYWELQKFLILALKANPNVLEVLHTPLVEHATPLARELLGMRRAFLSRLVYATYSGYVLSQFKKLSGDLRNKGEVKWKHVMHLIRLLISGVTALREGVVPVRVADEHKGRLLSIRDGRATWAEVDAWRLRLHEDFDAAFATTALPDRPDYARVNDFLVRARRSMT
jgi:hypothetical protein